MSGTPYAGRDYFPVSVPQTNLTVRRFQISHTLILVLLLSLRYQHSVLARGEPLAETGGDVAL